MKIMFCYDGSEIADKALAKTISYFKCQKPDMIILTVVEEPRDASMINEEIFEQWKQERHNELRKAAEFTAGQGLEVDAIMAVGDPREMILEAAEKKDPELIVIARRGMGESRVRRMVLGSVSAYIVRHAQRPVMVMTLKKGQTF